jgi:hypothetical protein
MWCGHPSARSDSCHFVMKNDQNARDGGTRLPKYWINTVSLDHVRAADASQRASRAPRRAARLRDEV